MPRRKSKAQIQAEAERDEQVWQLTAARVGRMLDDCLARGWRQSWMARLREIARDRGYETALVVRDFTQTVLDSMADFQLDGPARLEAQQAEILALQDQVLELENQLAKARQDRLGDLHSRQ